MRHIHYACLFGLLVTIITSCSSNRVSPIPSAAIPSNAASASPAVPTPGLSTSPTVSPSANVKSPNVVSPSPTATPVVPKKQEVYPDIPVEHIVIVVEENHAYSQIVGSDKAPYLQSLVKQGALLTNGFGVTHPSQPNYFALFSGSTQNIKDDSCKGPFTADNLSTELVKAKLSFAGYSEQQPSAGYTGCSSNGYARKHNPWAQFSNVPKEQNLPFSDFPGDFSKLPTVSFVVPAQQNDMHDGTIQEADDWLKKHIGDYVKWANEHNSLLIVTWDEDDTGHQNHIPVIFVGPMIKPGTYDDKINHYHVLRTIEDLFHLGHLGESKQVEGISTIWK